MTKQWRILRAIANAGAQGITAEELERIAYADDETGGPLRSRECVHVTVNKLKKRGFVFARGRTWNTRYYHRSVDRKAVVRAICARLVDASTEKEYASAYVELQKAMAA